MPVIPYAPETIKLGAWLWRNRRELGDAFTPIADRVESALAMPGEIQRIGSAVVSCRDGQTQVLGLLYQHDAKLDGIAEAINHLTTGHAALGYSLDALRHLSMLSLGVSAVTLGVATATLGVLLYQSRQLRAHIDDLKQQVAKLKDLIVAEQLALLETGLTQLQKGVNQIQAGNRQQGQDEIRFNAAGNLALSVNTHANLLTRELKNSKPERPVVRELFRHLAVALVGEVWCNLALGQHGDAAEAIRLKLRLAEEYTKTIFNQTVGDNPVRFLCPALKQHGVTVEFLAELFRQASHAGAIEGQPGVQAGDLIEQWRDQLHTARDPFRRSTLDRMRVELAEAVSAIEEVNRLKGFALIIDHVTSANFSFDAVMQCVRNETEEFVRCAHPEPGSWFAYFHNPVEPPSASGNT